MRWSVMVFAAGFGTRMQHLTREKPKPLIEVGGKPLIDHALDLTDALPASQTVVNLHYKADQLLEHLADRPVRTIVEAPDILETGGGLRNALPLLEATTVMTLNADVLWSGPNPLQQLAAEWDPACMDGLLMCIPRDRAFGYTGSGDFKLDAKGCVSRGPGVVFGCAQIIKTDRLNEIADAAFSLNVLWDLLMAENRLYATEFAGRWCDVGRPDVIPLAQEMLAARHV
ncbi:MAG: nucleotidyltransferase family protein [Roseobacter sp.]|jgi:MurNAc alpha-1-phosphate uridylyltransferase|nr:nucleotidyltransferase family protein [Roseobacter sp.]